MSDFVTCEVTDGVALVTLNRPDRLNAIGNEMGRIFDEIMVGLARNEEVRAVVLTGAGRGFCSGADMERLDRFAKTKGETSRFPMAGETRGAYTALDGAFPGELLTRFNIAQALPQPVIAAINGPCAGIGVMIAAMCDIRMASETAFFLAPFARRGLPAESGIAHILSHLVGTGNAADMLLSARRVPADEALRWGLVSRVLPEGEVLPTALELAGEMVTQMSPRSLRIIKSQLWEARHQSFFQALDRSMHETIAAMKSEDFQEGLDHFREKRPPRFTGR